MTKFIESLKRTRVTKLGWVTRMTQQCNDLLKSDELTYSRLVRLVDNLKAKWMNYEASHEAIIAKLIDDDEPDKPVNELNENHAAIEMEYLKNLTCFEDKLVELTISPNPLSPILEPPKVTLPTISLPDFAGDVSEWPAFWDKFNGLIHQRKDIAKINKFSYLLGQLKATALLVISQLPVTETNYDIAIKMLKDNYEDKDQIATKLVTKILDLKPPNHTYEDLQLFRITINSTLESLRVNNDVDAAEWLLRIIIQSKLNKKTVETLYYKYSKSYFSLQEIDTTLLEICKSISNEGDTRKQKYDSSSKVLTKERNKVAIRGKKSQYPVAGSTPRGNKPPERMETMGAIGSYTTTVNKPPVNTTTNDNATNNNASPTGTKPKTYRTCLFCSDKHDARNCVLYKGRMQRVARLKELGRCTFCLSSYHQGRNCQTRMYKCPICKEGIHHMLLCEVEENASKSYPAPGNTIPNQTAAVPVAEVQVQHNE